MLEFYYKNQLSLDITLDIFIVFFAILFSLGIAVTFAKIALGLGALGLISRVIANYKK